MSMVGSDLQHRRLRSLECSVVVYNPNSNTSSGSHPGLTLGDDYRYHTDLYVECGFQCNLVSPLGQ